MEKILIHICCGVCASWPVEKLMKEGFSVTGFFYNPNIHPKEEYDRRLNVVLELGREFKFDIICGSYDKQDWDKKVSGLEYEPEGGRRCLVCYRMRLEETYAESKNKGFDYFTTTLTISPRKDSQIINEVGSSVGSTSFISYDFKKEEGFKKANNFAKTHLFYRQNYCGCVFSQRNISTRH